MATILAFAGGLDRRKRTIEGRAADIIFFPGVRVEYHEQPSESVQPVDDGRPRRGGRRGQKRILAG